MSRHFPSQLLSVSIYESVDDPDVDFILIVIIKALHLYLFIVPALRLTFELKK